MLSLAHTMTRNDLSGPSAFATYNRQTGRFTEATPTFADASGWSRTELLALDSVTEVLAADEREIVRKLIDRRASGALQEIRYTTKLVRRSGSAVDVELRGSEESGDRFVLGTFANAEDQVQRFTSLGRLSAQVAHEFNNVLMGIQPAIDVIRRSSLDPRAQRAAEIICSSVQRGKKITTDVLRFGCPQQISLELVDMHDLVRTTADEIRPMLGAIDLRIELPTTPLEITADAAKLAQVLINLSLNAKDSMHDSGTLTIRVEPDRDWVRIDVTDSGPGIAAADLAHIFEPLFTTKRSGTGLGLFVVHRIVTAHGGVLSVESEPGAGATFHIAIPRVAVAIPQSA